MQSKGLRMCDFLGSLFLGDTAFCFYVRPTPTSVIAAKDGRVRSHPPERGCALDFAVILADLKRMHYLLRTVVAVDLKSMHQKSVSDCEESMASGGLAPRACVAFEIPTSVALHFAVISTPSHLSDGLCVSCSSKVRSHRRTNPKSFLFRCM